MEYDENYMVFCIFICFLFVCLIVVLQPINTDFPGVERDGRDMNENYEYFAADTNLTVPFALYSTDEGKIDINRFRNKI